VLAIDPKSGAQMGEAVLEHEDDGSPFVGGARPYISAVIVNEPAYRFDEFDRADDFTKERPMRARVIHHPFAITPLPLSVFADDDQIVYCDNRWQEAASHTRRDHDHTA
jgi:hypothetical protein